MVTAQVAPYGSWRSPITAELAAAAGVIPGFVRTDGGDIWWTELRPAEGGRVVLVRRTPDGAVVDVTPPPFNVRTRVHEYGGGAYAVADGVVYFANYADQRLYQQVPGRDPVPLTPDGVDLRYADMVVDRARARIVCVREDHTDPAREAINTLVTIDLGAGGPGEVLVGGNDFYAAPRLSPDGTRLAWLTWAHPNMPWDGTELWVADLGPDGRIASAACVAGGEGEAVFQPEWSADGVLYFVSDPTGWWNLYRYDGHGIEQVTTAEAEFGRPHWVFGLSTYAFESPERIVCAYAQRGFWHLATLDVRTRRLRPLETPYSTINFVRATPGRALFVGGSAVQPLAVVAVNLESGGHQALSRASTVAVDDGYLSNPEAVEFPTEGGLTAHGLYYPPRNRDCQGPPGDRPPLIVISHGGPTGAAVTTLDLALQFWTSRGFAVLDVNYGGSAGYGRAYRERLKGRWGEVDVDDCANGARYLVARGDVDPDRLIIRGGSAGGFTTLCALVFRDVFTAGAAYYGVSDLEALAQETHKFESRYETTLVGPYPERADLYRARSPIHFADRLSRPVIFFQGLEDVVVPPAQSERMVAALRANGVPVAYLAFEGEQHGFRRAETIRRALEAELFFYARVFGIPLADPVQPIAIDNLP